MYFNELTIRYGLSNILTLNESVSYNVTSYSFKTFKLFGWVLTDVTAADFLERTKRLRLVYVLRKNNNVLYYSNNLEIQENIQSATAQYSIAIPLEREIFEMFGILFTEHQDLRKLLLDYSYVGNPLRKDYPVTGYNQISFTALKVLVFKELNLSQDLRMFVFPQVWLNNK